MTTGLPCPWDVSEMSESCTLWTKPPRAPFCSPTLCVCIWNPALSSASSSLPRLCSCLIHHLSPWVTPSRPLLLLSFSSSQLKRLQSKYISYSIRPSSLPFPGHFRFARKSLKGNVLFSFCSHHVLPSPFVRVEITSSLYAWCTLS